LLAFLAQQRDALRASVLGLKDEQARAAPAASGLSLGGLIKHAAGTERRWVVAGIAGQPPPGLWPSRIGRMTSGWTTMGRWLACSATTRMTLGWLIPEGAARRSAPR
jgi:hypothetical protein